MPSTAGRIPHSMRPSAMLKLAAAIIACAAACDGAPRSAAGDAEADRATAVQADTAVPVTPALAVTIDDLPWIGAVRPGETREDALRSLIEALLARDVPAVGFANCDR
ncbi:MAG: hypothetical protein ACREK1_13225, partial [Longimicrobiales bacterium]